MCTKLWKRIDEYPDYWVSSIGEIYSTKSNKFLKLTTEARGYVHVGLFNDNGRKTLKVHRLVAMAFIPNPENKKEVDHINTISDDNRVENLRWVTCVENANNELTKQHKSEAASGENNPMWGKHHSEESNRKNAEAHKGKCVSDETRIKLSEANSGENNPMCGKHHSKESKKKMSEKAKIRFANSEDHPRAHAVRCIELDKIFTSIEEAKKVTDATCISKCCRGERKTSGGYHWEYVDDL